MRHPSDLLGNRTKMSMVDIHGLLPLHAIGTVDSTVHYIFMKYQ